jgi:cyclic pyranopterin phosphate synthase
MTDPNTGFTHVNEYGKANMVDVTNKQVTQRQAVAEGYISMSERAFSMLMDNSHAKGDVLSIAQIAGIQGAKKCSDLVPLCHPLMLSKVQIEFETIEEQRKVRIQALCKLAGQTGVEMEALTAVSVAALTLFDMCKAVDPHMQISDIKVLSKKGGKSGDWAC